VAEVLRGVVRRHATECDALLWEDADFLRGQFYRWHVPQPTDAGAAAECGKIA
jgi:hypothetical protein